MIVRPVQVSDLPALMTLVQQAGPGFTTLPANEDRLAHRVRWAQRAFAEQVERADADYLFVLEDDEQRVIGVSALAGAVGLREPWYNYRVGLTVSSAPDLGIQRQIPTLFLNNELTDFTFAPEKDGAPVANRVEGGKRPLSSMSPTIVYDAKGKPVFTVGAAGGKTIIMQVAKALIAHLDWGMSARDSIGQGLVYFSPQGIILEQGTSLEAMKPALEQLGHKVSIAKLGLKANAAELTATGWEGAADPRSVGVALKE